MEAAEKITNMPVLGTYEGECADAEITNLNGLDITRQVWENVFSSEDYKKAIKLGWYIGFLGHPEDPNCMDFEHACIVMTDGYIDAQGKVHGKFNLIDTPVGRIVWAFQEAGVIFGISVRGAGDIVGNSVDPDTFIFRGFDLVTFPAFPDSIPTFTKIAASSDIESQKKYKRVCAAVNENLQDIDDVNVLDTIQSQFAAQSEEYKRIEAKKAELNGAGELDDIPSREAYEVMASKLEAMTQLYVEASTRVSELENEVKATKVEATTKLNRLQRKLKAVERITASQEKRCRSNAEFERRYHTAVHANKRLKTENSELKDENLNYKMNIEKANRQLANKESVISSMRLQLDETVNDVKNSQHRASNLDVKMKRLEKQVEASKQQLTASKKLCSEYQKAYASLYADAAGVDLSKVPITANMSIQDVQSAIYSSSVQVPEVTMQSPEVVDTEDYVSEDDLVVL